MPMHLLTLTNDDALRETLRTTLGEAGCEFHPASVSPSQLEEPLARKPDALLLDLAGQPDSGAAFLETYGDRADRIPLLVLCPEADRDVGLRAVRAGALDYLLRPLSMDELGIRLRRIQETEHLRRETIALRTALERTAARSTLIAESPAMGRIRDSAQAKAGTREPVLIVGERGSGKKTLAEFIHRLDNQKKLPVGIISCSGLGDRLFQSSAWREAREAGTAILEGVESLPRAEQDALTALLTRQAQEPTDNGHRPVRVIALSETPLNEPAHRREFSPALFQLFSNSTFVLPALRDHAADVPALLAHFAQRTAQRLGRPVSVSPRALAMLAVYPWPGNVAELEAAVERAALLGGNGRLEYADFGLVPGLAGPGDSPAGALELKPQVEAFERQVLLQALAATKGNRQAAAKLLGISLRTLFYKIKRYGVEGKEGLGNR
ncbi:MAG: helix-turn-helix domain-containing protein [Gemmatimonadota bacterium]